MLTKIEKIKRVLNTRSYSSLSETRMLRIILSKLEEDKLLRLRELSLQKNN
jgi:hypothetical protein